MGHWTKPQVLAVATLVLGVGTGPLRADAIDGEWCDSNGQHFTIKGPEILTPEGTRTTGDYSRHAFSYRNPQTGAGDSG